MSGSPIKFVFSMKVLVHLGKYSTFQNINTYYYLINYGFAVCIAFRFVYKSRKWKAFRGSRNVQIDGFVLIQTTNFFIELKITCHYRNIQISQSGQTIFIMGQDCFGNTQPSKVEQNMSKLSVISYSICLAVYTFFGCDRKKCMCTEK